MKEIFDIRGKRNRVKSKNITLQDIQGILKGKSLVIRVQNFFDDKAIKPLLEATKKARKIDYLNDIQVNGKTLKVPYGVWRVGAALNTVFGVDDPQEKKCLLNNYFEETKVANTLIKKALGNIPSPRDTLFASLGKAWPKGIQVATIQKKKAMCGMLRGTESGVTPMVEAPHIDTIRNEAIKGIKVQLSALFILSCPKVGGELLIYPVTPFDVNGKETESNYIKNAVKTLKPISIKPMVGDLIIFNPRQPHATTSFLKTDSERIAMHTFMGYRGDSKALIAWN